MWLNTDMPQPHVIEAITVNPYHRSEPNSIKQYCIEISLTLGAHAQRGLRYCCCCVCVCVCVCVSVCLSVYGAFNSLYDGSFALKTITPTERVNIFI